MAFQPKFGATGVRIAMEGGITRTTNTAAIVQRMLDGSPKLLVLNTTPKRTWEITMEFVSTVTLPSLTAASSFTDETNTTYTVIVEPGSVQQTVVHVDYVSNTTYYDVSLTIHEV